MDGPPLPQAGGRFIFVVPEAANINADANNAGQEVQQQQQQQVMDVQNPIEQVEEVDGAQVPAEAAVPEQVNAELPNVEQVPNVQPELIPQERPAVGQVVHRDAEAGRQARIEFARNILERARNRENRARQIFDTVQRIIDIEMFYVNMWEVYRLIPVNYRELINNYFDLPLQQQEPIKVICTHLYIESMWRQRLINDDNRQALLRDAGDLPHDVVFAQEQELRADNIIEVMAQEEEVENEMDERHQVNVNVEENNDEEEEEEIENLPNNEIGNNNLNIQPRGIVNNPLRRDIDPADVPAPLPPAFRPPNLPAAAIDPADEIRGRSVLYTLINFFFFLVWFWKLVVMFGKGIRWLVVNIWHGILYVWQQLTAGVQYIRNRNEAEHVQDRNNIPVNLQQVEQNLQNLNIGQQQIINQGFNLNQFIVEIMNLIKLIIVLACFMMVLQIYVGRETSELNQNVKAISFPFIKFGNVLEFLTNLAYLPYEYVVAGYYNFNSFFLNIIVSVGNSTMIEVITNQTNEIVNATILIVNETINNNKELNHEFLLNVMNETKPVILNEINNENLTFVQNLEKLIENTFDFSNEDVWEMSKNMYKGIVELIYYSLEVFEDFLKEVYDSIEVYARVLIDFIGNCKLSQFKYFAHIKVLLIFLGLLITIFNVLFKFSYDYQLIHLLIVFGYSVNFMLATWERYYETMDLMGLLFVIGIFFFSVITMIVKFFHGRRYVEGINKTLQVANELSTLNEIKMALILFHIIMVLFNHLMIGFFIKVVNLAIERTIETTMEHATYFLIFCVTILILIIIKFFIEGKEFFYFYWFLMISLLCFFIYFFSSTIAGFVMFIIVLFFTRFVFNLLNWILGILYLKLTGFYFNIYSMDESTEQKKTSIAIFKIMTSFRLMMAQYSDTYIVFVSFIPILYTWSITMKVSQFLAITFGGFCFYLIIFLLYIHFTSFSISEDKFRRKYDVSYMRSGYSPEVIAEATKAAINSYQNYLRDFIRDHNNAERDFNKFYNEYIKDRLEKEIRQQIAMNSNVVSLHQSDLDFISKEFARRTNQMFRAFADENRFNGNINDINGFLENVNNQIPLNRPQLEMLNINANFGQPPLFPVVDFNRFLMNLNGANCIVEEGIEADTPAEARRAAVYIWKNRGMIDDVTPYLEKPITSDDKKFCFKITEKQIGKKVTHNNIFEISKVYLYPRLRDAIQSLNFFQWPFLLFEDDSTIGLQFREFIVSKHYATRDEGKNDLSYGQSYNSVDPKLENFLFQLIDPNTLIKTAINEKHLTKVIKSLMNDYDKFVLMDDVFKYYGIYNWDIPMFKLKKYAIVTRGGKLYFCRPNDVKDLIPAFRKLELKNNKQVICISNNASRKNYMIGHLQKDCSHANCKSDISVTTNNYWIAEHPFISSVFVNYNSTSNLRNYRAENMFLDLFAVSTREGLNVSNAFIALYRGVPKIITTLHSVGSRLDGLFQSQPRNFSTEPDRTPMLEKAQQFTKQFDDDFCKLTNDYGVTFIIPKNFFIKNRFYGELKAEKHMLVGELIISDICNFKNYKPQYPVGYYSGSDLKMIHLDVVDDMLIPQVDDIVTFKGEDKEVLLYWSGAGDSGSPIMENGNIIGVHVGGINSGYGSNIEMFTMNGTTTKSLLDNGPSGQNYNMTEKNEKELLDNRDHNLVRMSVKNGKGLVQIGGKLKTFYLNELKDIISDILNQLGPDAKIELIQGEENFEYEPKTFGVTNYADLVSQLEMISETQDDEGYVSQLLYFAQNIDLIPGTIAKDLITKLGEDTAKELIALDLGDLKGKKDDLSALVMDLKARLITLENQEKSIMDSPQVAREKQNFEKIMQEYLEKKMTYDELMCEYLKKKEESQKKRKAILEEKERIQNDLKGLMKQVELKYSEFLRPKLERIDDIKKNIIAIVNNQPESSKELKVELEAQKKEFLDQLSNIQIKLKQVKDQLKKLNSGEIGENASLLNSLRSEKKKLEESVKELNKERKEKVQQLANQRKEIVDKYDTEIKSLRVEPPPQIKKPIKPDNPELKKIVEKMQDLKKELKQARKLNWATETLIRCLEKRSDDDAQSMHWATDNILDNVVRIKWLMRNTDLEDLKEFLIILIRSFEEFIISTNCCYYLAITDVMEALAFALGFHDDPEIMKELAIVRDRRICLDSCMRCSEVVSQRMNLLYTQLSPNFASQPAFKNSMPCYLQPAALVCSKCNVGIRCPQAHLENTTGTLRDVLCTFACYDDVHKRLSQHRSMCTKPEMVSIRTTGYNDQGIGFACVHAGEFKNLRQCVICKKRDTTNPCISMNYNTHTPININLNGHSCYLHYKCLLTFAYMTRRPHSKDDCEAPIPMEIEAIFEGASRTGQAGKNRQHIQVTSQNYLDLDELSKDTYEAIRCAIQDVLVSVTCVEESQAAFQDDEFSEEALNNLNFKSYITKLIENNNKTQRKFHKGGKKNKPNQLPKTRPVNQNISIKPLDQGMKELTTLMLQFTNVMYNLVGDEAFDALATAAKGLSDITTMERVITDIDEEEESQENKEEKFEEEQKIEEKEDDKKEEEKEKSQIKRPFLVK